jgi:hypothetical protein
MKIWRETVWPAALVAGATLAVAQSRQETGAITSSTTAESIAGRVLNADGGN